MFIYTLKASSIKFFAVLSLSVIALVALITLVPNYDTVGEAAIVTTNYSGIKTNEDRVNFISTFGYKVSGEAENTEVIIPEKFDSVYSKYNDLQRSQGLNLKKFQGKNVSKYSYFVDNYKDYKGRVVITLLVHKNSIIAGDVCGIDGEGFLHGFQK
ncbi:MAG: DUF4830 domain-containing protein [Clostridia bacterium]